MKTMQNTHNLLCQRQVFFEIMLQVTYLKKGHIRVNFLSLGKEMLGEKCFNMFKRESVIFVAEVKSRSFHPDVFIIFWLPYLCVMDVHNISSGEEQGETAVFVG